MTEFGYLRAKLMEVVMKAVYKANELEGRQKIMRFRSRLEQ